ncbi:MAG: LamG protein [Ignavibacteria bacterium]|nr:LamG protein [Ignavibacteria bacterium]
MITKLNKTERKGRHFSVSQLFMLIAVGLILIGSELFAQTYYSVSLNQRRMGDTIGVEVWIKSADATNATQLGNMTLNVLYNSTYLSPTGTTAYATTDSILFDIPEASDPYQTIQSNYSSQGTGAVYGFGTMSASAGSGLIGGSPTSFYGLQVVLNTTTGFKPLSTGKGSFVGLLKFKILQATAITNAILTGISINEDASVGSPIVMTAGGTNVTTNVDFTSTSDFKLRGITLLNPIGLNQTVNRYPVPTYQFMSAFNNHSYPIYFERSGLLLANAGTDETYGTNKLAYKFEYSLDNGTLWTEFGRVAETVYDVVTLGENVNNHRSDDIDTLSDTYNYTVTQGNGTDSLYSENNGFSGILRVLWKGDSEFLSRSEVAKMKITQLDTASASTTTTITSRTLITSYTEASRYAVSPYTFILGRLFFVQLDGSSSYLRTSYNYEGAAQLTVEAWVNLNHTPSNFGGYPAIVASSAGPTSNEEGAWMLYLNQGKYPAFKCREMSGRGLVDSFLAVVVSPDSLTTSNPVVPIVNAHTSHWTHVAATVENNVVTLYVNGEIVDKQTNKNAKNIQLLQTKHPIWIGLNPNTTYNTGIGPSNLTSGTFTSTNYLHGGVKEVRVWRTALTQDQLRARIIGVTDPDGSTTPVGSTSQDLRTALDMDFSFQGARTDVAGDYTWQAGPNVINLYTTSNILSSASNSSINFRPDRPHIKLTAPVGNEGVVNRKDFTFDVRWVSYGFSSSYDSVQVQATRDGGNNWFDGIASDGNPMINMSIVNGQATWEPYRNQGASNDVADDLQSVVPLVTAQTTFDGNFDKTCQLRIVTSDGNWNSIYDQSSDFTVAPYFAFENNGSSYIRVPSTTTINLTGAYGFIESWINPYKLPTSGKFFPIFSKRDTSTAKTMHYSLRLLSTGQLQFAVGSSSGTIYTATSLSTDPIVAPNSRVFDSVWTHVGVWFNLANGGTGHQVIFYIDGTPQSSSSVQFTATSGISVNSLNLYPAFIGYEPDASAELFLGMIRDLRVWGSNPAGMDATGTEPTSLSKFVQGACTVPTDSLTTILGTDYSKNLRMAFLLNGGSFISNGNWMSVSAFPSRLGLDAKVMGYDVSYKATPPFVKLVEPVFEQSVPTTQTDLRVRWVGSDFTKNNELAYDASTAPTFRAGDSTYYPDLWFSTRGGGGMAFTPFKYVASMRHNVASYVNSLTLPSSNSEYEFPGSFNASQYSGILDVSMANPEVAGELDYSEQGEIPSSMTQGQLQLRARTYINGSFLEYENEDDGRMYSLLSKSKVFDITPPSNYTVRVLLEGFHRGNQGTDGMPIGTSYVTGGLRISMYEDNGSSAGTKLDSAESTLGYYTDASTLNPTTPVIRGTDGSTYGNVPFIFRTLSDGRYFVKVDHINHLPILSRYATPFYFSGDAIGTWDVESGWDFQNWDGTDDQVTEAEAATEPPTIGTKYTAYGNSIVTKGEPNWGNTGLSYNNGNGDEDIDVAFAAMVGGDAVKDGQINSADRTKIVIAAGSSNNYESDVNGDGFVNATDRLICDNNFNKGSSIAGLGLIAGTGNGFNTPSIILPEEPELSMMYIKAAKLTSELLSKQSNPSAPIFGKNQDRVLAAGINYKVMAETKVNGQFVDVDVYIQNTGDDFAMGNATFAINFNAGALKFESLIRNKEVIFNERPDLGYFQQYSAPNMNTKNPISDLRTIEIDFDSHVFNGKHLPGQIVPRIKTYVGTLRFQVVVPTNEYSFTWHRSKVVHDVDGVDKTSKGTFLPISPIITSNEIAIIVPNGGEILQSGDVYNISWTKPAEEVLVHIELSLDNGKSWQRITTAPTSAMSQKFIWKVPQANSAECLVRLTNSENGTEIDRSDAVFTINPPALQLIRPAASDPTYAGGSSDYIKWKVSNTSNIRFEFSSDGGTKWTSVTAVVNANLDQVKWTLPSVNTKTAVVRMINNDNGTEMIRSGYFRILVGKVTLTSPTDGKKITLGTQETIKWTFNGVTRFDLQFSRDGGATWEKLANNVVASKYNLVWSVPKINTDKGIIRAVLVGDPSMEYSRTGVFSIVGPVSDVKEWLADGYLLQSVQPNPFAEQANVEFSIPRNEKVTISIFNEAGMKVATIINGQEFDAGTYRIDIDGTSLANGMYVVRIEAGLFNEAQKVIHIK